MATTVPTFPGFPLGVMAGTYTQTFDSLSADTYNPVLLDSMMLMGNVSAVEELLFTSIEEGNAYLNIHSEEFPMGEIRGFLAPVPEPAPFSFQARRSLLFRGCEGGVRARKHIFGSDQKAAIG